MHFASRASLPVTHLLGAFALAAAGVATAADVPQLPHVDGLVQLPHTRVVNAPAEAIAAAGRAESGMRAFIDSETGALRAPTAEEAAALSEQGASRASLARAAEPQVLVLPNGTKRIMLTEAQMQYSVVQRAADGSLVESCVTGESKAEHLAHSKAPIAARRVEELR